jgi:hypothetical protein
MSSTVGTHEEKAELEAVFASGIFNRAPGLAQMLTYVCTKYFEGKSDQVKEYSIAVEALGRPADFDQKKDSIVRVEAHRLRKRLSEFYEGEGASHKIRIVLPSGQYVPHFVTVESPAALPPAENPKTETEIVTLSPAVIVEPAIPEPRRRPPLQMVLLGTLGLILAAGAVAYVAARPALGTLAPNRVPAVTPEGEEIRILAGARSPLTDQLGRRWDPDRYASGGWVVSAPGHVIDGTRDSIIYQNSREGDFQYDIPLKPGVYELHLHFAETVYGEHNSGGGGETMRLFSVQANGKPLLEYFDVISDAHGASVADEKVFKDISPAGDGELHLSFTHRVRDAFVNAIEILPGIPGHLRPIRIAMRDQPYLDRKGNLWQPDRYFRGGQSLLRARFAAGTDDPDLYRGERFGNITYVIPVAPGSYTVTLKFSEGWFGPGKPAGGGAGSRLFDIVANSQMLVRNFDVFKEAGGTDRAVDRTFHKLQPNAQGKLVISLEPEQNYSCINAIEVISDGK